MIFDTRLISEDVLKREGKAWREKTYLKHDRGRRKQIKMMEEGSEGVEIGWSTTGLCKYSRFLQIARKREKAQSRDVAYVLYVSVWNPIPL